MNSNAKSGLGFTLMTVGVIAGTCVGITQIEKNVDPPRRSLENDLQLLYQRETALEEWLKESIQMNSFVPDTNGYRGARQMQVQNELCVLVREKDSVLTALHENDNLYDFYYLGLPFLLALPGAAVYNSAKVCTPKPSLFS